MKKNIFSCWLFLLAVFSVSIVSAQVTIGNTKGMLKTAEDFSALEVLSNGKGGLRLPQLSTNQRNTLSLGAISDPIKQGLANGLSIYNTTTNCVEYWNSNRWISLCEGTSQAIISPEPCTNVSPDGTGCDQTFTITDPDCPNGPFAILIVSGNEYATLTDVNAIRGTFKVVFKQNDSVTPHSVLVRVTSSCSNQFKDFIFLQNGVTCEALGTAPTISPAGSNLNLCLGGAVYLSVPENSVNVDRIIWTRNGIEVARGVNFYVATLKGVYNISLGAAGCNVNSGNERIITESGTAPGAINTIITSNNGLICGPGGSITLTAVGASGSVSWFKDGVLQSSKTGTKITLTGTADTGNWFAAAGSQGCYSKPSNTVKVIVTDPSGTPITFNMSDVLVNNKAINTITSFCQGGSLVLKVNNPQPGVSYTWYNDETIITSPYTIPAGQASILLRMVATDNSGAACPVEARSTEVSVSGGSAPGTPSITGTGVICDGTADLTVVPKETGSFTYQWYKNGILVPVTTQTISVTDPGAVYSATVTNPTGCVSALVSKTIATEVSSLPVLSWVSTGTTANYGDKITYQLAIENGPATYAWSVTGGASFVGTGTSINVTFPSSGSSVQIKVKATNACGTSAELTKTILLSAACPTPVVSAASQTAFSTVVGIGIQARVSVTQGNQQTYQWYSNTTASTTNGSVISGATQATINYSPVSASPSVVYLYCIVKNGCSGTPLASSTPLFTVNVTADPGNLALGSGIFTGKTCFDINKSNYDGSCGTQVARNANMTNFQTQNVQQYVFTASATGTKKNLRFVVVDPLGAVQSTNADAMALPGSLANSQVVTLTVTYKTNLSDIGSIAYGKSTDQSVNVKIYAVYNDGNSDFALPLNVKIQDCACCGAFVAAGVWKNFMCHNLGADQTLDPNVIAQGLRGDYYQYGQTIPMARSITTGPLAPFVNVAGNSSWQGNASEPKGVNDPCPAGYRIPSIAEWNGVAANNTSTFVTSSNPNTMIYMGTKIGSQLFLPFVGSYQHDGLFRGYGEGKYAAADKVGYKNRTVTTWMLQLSGSASNPTPFTAETYTTGGPFWGLPIRCIEQ
ncbi:hypothetical protein SAMN05444397_1093 [Flavobacterium aquidurense]|uniref:Ig-like domain-containing protein n=1 Tax=Flavobacterium frigidimaris TaxID=262320 RepID=A0ABX4BQ52_FLAFR|nr:hypothetical protein [Flavobacterium frigidimaris]OXA78518.1 hypothetical protein B0A65_12315 [Flavobacterium frigidimaris]SDZ56504.1 hypothetical protein SAMN05444397_1093 [Flavobacterium aquidurense]